MNNAKSSGIHRVAILGAGVMGSQLAALFANAGVSSLLYDVTQEAAVKNLERLKTLRPTPFFDPKAYQLIIPCNYDEHLGMLRETDWVIEAVIERLAVKKALFYKILPYLNPGTFISSNTSGLLLKDICQDMPADFVEHFLITHFFNPPRYMHLLEVIPGEETLPEVVDAVVEFSENVLGKGIVYAKDTPNFVANRIGVYSLMMAMGVARSMDLSVEAVDRLTGIAMGRPGSATFRTADLIGLDTLALVSLTIFEKCPDDEMRNVFRIPDYMQLMVERNWLGQKTGQGFYKKVGREILSLNLDILEYRPMAPVEFEGLRLIADQQTTTGKIRELINSPDIAGQFAWEVISNTLIYAANRILEVADDIINIDRAMRWGFGWQLGIFELWDAIGFQESVERMVKENKPVPEWVLAMAESDTPAFYRQENKSRQYFNVHYGEMNEVPPGDRVVDLTISRKHNKMLYRNWNASLYELDEQVLCLEFHSIVDPNSNWIDLAVCDVFEEAFQIIPREDYRALVVANQGAHFSSGFNLELLLNWSERGEWSELESFCRRIQELGQQLRYSSFPVITAVHHRTLDTGLQLALCSDLLVANAELYCGFTEVQKGIIPIGGSIVKLLTNCYDKLPADHSGPFPPVWRGFENIMRAEVTTSAAGALQLGYLGDNDEIIINRDHLIYSARERALKLADGYRPPESYRSFKLPGEGGRVAIETRLAEQRKRGLISDFDKEIGSRLAFVITGGNEATSARAVDEQVILALEIEAFLSLCKEPRSQERMRYWLEHHRPLRN